MLKICKYCHERINPAKEQLHLKKCLQYRRMLKFNKIELNELPVIDTKKKNKTKKIKKTEKD